MLLRRYLQSASRLRIMEQSSTFTRVVVSTMRQLYPEDLADKSFDNTGLLLESPHQPHSQLRNSVLLTIDLTTDVANEAIEGQHSVVISYHPIIFRPLKSLTLANPQQHNILRLVQNGISVYCPHTAIDAAPRGLNDWLADVITSTSAADDTGIDHNRSVIRPVEGIKGFEKAGMGKIVRFKNPQPLESLLHNVGIGLKCLPHVPVAIPYQEKVEDIKISSVGICAGSGGALLGQVDVDLIFTGELSHHEALAAIEAGKVVIAPYHTNTERGFLSDRLKPQLQNALQKSWADILDTEFHEHCEEVNGAKGQEVQVEVSARDKDPYELYTIGSRRS